ncbi:hypothetical protein HLI17_28750 [Rhizobium laguerreae]|uniref:3,4-dihydroxy-2-butanone 4-phosphate synthase n=1 Tax=Rhizobium laguerreae TaxID=1076926 RepID=A0A7Y2W875_9HYPH|nr:hypothetical protein [Rhizobium laguerreae]
MAISRIEDAIDSIRRRKMTVLVDNEDRENEGDIMVAADAATTPDTAFMMKHARGLICVAMKARDYPLMDGTMARLPALIEFADQHGVHVATIEDLKAYWLMNSWSTEASDSSINMPYASVVSLPSGLGRRSRRDSRGSPAHFLFKANGAASQVRANSNSGAISWLSAARRAAT